MTIEELKRLKEQDLKPIDRLDLTSESLNVATLHARWIDIFRDHHTQLIKARYKANVFKKKISRYYKGMTSREELKSLGKTHQFQEQLGRQELENYVNGDPDYAKLKGKVEILESDMDYIGNILENIKQRGWSIKTAVEYERFVSGA